MHITYYIFYTHWHIDRQMAVQLVEISWGVSSRKGKCCLLLNIRRNWQPSHSFSHCFVIQILTKGCTEAYVFRSLLEVAKTQTNRKDGKADRSKDLEQVSENRPISIITIIYLQVYAIYVTYYVRYSSFCSSSFLLHI